MASRILVIEDDPASLDLMVYLLKAFGQEPLVARDGQEALDVAYRARPDLIICDIQLPRLDGYQVASALKGHPALRTIPLIAVTAYAMVGDRDRILGAGFDDYIAKPIVPELFIKQIQSHVDSGLWSKPGTA
ncbi:MAG TPA: response regulator [Dehalococcoidia bacterium]|nr:response regulator [Dehalococcoidia bacterium]